MDSWYRNIRGNLKIEKNGWEKNSKFLTRYDTKNILSEWFTSF